MDYFLEGGPVNGFAGSSPVVPAIIPKKLWDGG